MYTVINFKSKKAIKDALAEGKKLKVYQAGGIYTEPLYPATVTLEGPHYPEPHRWYASAKIDKDGHIISIK